MTFSSIISILYQFCHGFSAICSVSSKFLRDFLSLFSISFPAHSIQFFVFVIKQSVCFVDIILIGFNSNEFFPNSDKNQYLNKTHFTNFMHVNSIIKSSTSNRAELLSIFFINHMSAMPLWCVNTSRVFLLLSQSIPIMIKLNVCEQ